LRQSPYEHCLHDRLELVCRIVHSACGYRSPPLRLVVSVNPKLPADDPADPVAEVRGINVHARQVVGGRDRRQLERLARYVTRPLVAQDRLTMRSDGMLELAFKSIWKDGTRAIVFSPEDFVLRLIAAIGFGRGLNEAGPCKIAGVEPLRSSTSMPPWEDIPRLRNTQAFHWDDLVGASGIDNYIRAEVHDRIEVSREQAILHTKLLRQGGIEAGPAAGATLCGARQAIAPIDEGNCLLVFADGKVAR
jgi:hypothetical protein